MCDRTIAHGFGFISEHVRTTAFFARLCKCGYDYDKGRQVTSGIPFPPIIFDILNYIMPICGVHDEALWPTALNINFYKNGYDENFNLLFEPLQIGQVHLVGMKTMSRCTDHYMSLTQSYLCH
jgi:hypothetical protein